MKPPIDLIKLRELCEKATPGEWYVEDERTEGNNLPWRSTGLVWSKNRGDCHPGTPICQTECRGLHAGSPKEKIEEFEANAALIAALNPSTVLSLLDEVERLRADNNVMREALRACVCECDEQDNEGGTVSCVKCVAFSRIATPEGLEEK